MKLLNQLFSETVVALVLSVLLVCFINPFDWWMTDAVHMTLLGLVAAFFAIFAMLVWKETVSDEREQLHRFIAARLAYTVGGMILLVGTVLQALAHAIDPWLPAALAGMVLAKILGRFYARTHY